MSASACSSVKKFDAIIAEEIIKKMRINLSKAKWLALMELMQDISMNGIIYGGAVRSYIIRTSASKKYYFFCEQENIDADVNFCNPDVHPESFHDRNTFPTDIDVFMTQSKFKEFIKHKKNYNLKKKSVEKTNYFLSSNELFKSALSLYKYEASIINFCSSVVREIIFGEVLDAARDEDGEESFNLQIKIDFVVIRDDFMTKHYVRNHPMESKLLYPPFGNPDFDVNLLCFVIKKDEIDSITEEITIKPLPILKRLLAQRAETQQQRLRVPFRPLHDYTETKRILDEIITGILNKKARPVFPIPEEYTFVFGKYKQFALDKHRIVKMLKRGFTIDKYNIIVEPTIRDTIIWQEPLKTDIDADADKECCICYQAFTETDCVLNCCFQCNVKMHQICATKLLQKKENIKCPHCRADITHDKCYCKFITFLNALDYASTAFLHDIKQIKQTCSDCKLDISIHTNPACSCYSITCKCKQILELTVD